MDLPVQAHGLLIPEAPWEGPVVSLFSRAFNVLHPSGLLVGVVASLRQMSPFSLLAEELFAADWGQAPVARIAKGAPFRRTGTGLLVSGIRLDLGHSRRWDGRLGPRLTRSIADPGSTANLLRSALAEAGAEDGLREIVVGGTSQTIFGRRAREILNGVRIEKVDGPARLRGLSELVGLGIGFTPSGDDFLSGVMLAAEMSEAIRVEVDAEEIRSALGRTNDGGRTLLAGALDRCFPAYLLEFACAIAAAQQHGTAGATTAGAAVPGSRDHDGTTAERAVLAAVRSAASHGETSGTDSVTGFTWYLETIVR